MRDVSFFYYMRQVTVVLVLMQNLLAPINSSIDLNHCQPAELAKVNEAHVVHLGQFHWGTEAVGAIGYHAPLHGCQALTLVSYDHQSSFLHELSDDVQADLDLVSHVQYLELKHRTHNPHIQQGQTICKHTYITIIYIYILYYVILHYIISYSFRYHIMNIE